ncbi:MAG: hypothetical protein IJR72_03845 [Oscillospiraceae bacterium]|nr:hypothetical protein [Oscillospiraceae bacterium]
MTRDEKFDVFIAYHGNKYKGSEAQAQMLYEKIKGIPLIGGKKNRPYFHPEVNRYGSFKQTPEIVRRTPLFLLVVNKNIPRDQYGGLLDVRDDGTWSYLYGEVSAFHTSRMYECCSTKDAAKVFITDDFSHTLAQQLHTIFSDTIALSTENEVIDWIQNFYQNSYPSVLCNQFRFLVKRSRDDLWRSGWADEAEFYWKNCRIEEIAKLLLAFYCEKFGYSNRTDRTALEKARTLCQELSCLNRKSGLRPDTLEVLTRAINRLNM